MPLTWNASEIQYFKDNPDEIWIKAESFGEEYDDVNYETKGLIFGSMATCIGSITEAKAPEFYARWKVLEKFDNFNMFSKWNEETKQIEDVPLSPEVIAKHINLSMNVSYISTTQWVTNLLKRNKEINLSSKEIKAFLVVYELEYKEKMGLL